MQGYDHLSVDMAEYPEIAIFRTFKILNYRALLFKQSELAQKESLLISAIKEDQNSGDPERQQFAFSFDAMLKSKSEDEGSKLQRELMRDICRLLTEYSMCRKLHDELPPVHKPNLEALRDALRSVPGSPGPRFFLRGRELRIWSEKKEYDLTSLTEQKEGRDPLSSWLEWWITHVFHKHFGNDARYDREPLDEDWATAVPSKLVQYPQRSIARIVTVVSTVLAPILLTLSVSTLFFLDDERLRLGIIVLLSFLFSVALACVGVPRRIDSFVATATFTAVLIVFISNNTGCAC